MLLLFSYTLRVWKPVSKRFWELATLFLQLFLYCVRIASKVHREAWQNALHVLKKHEYILVLRNIVFPSTSTLKRNLQTEPNYSEQCRSALSRLKGVHIFRHLRKKSVPELRCISHLFEREAVWVLPVKNYSKRLGVQYSKVFSSVIVNFVKLWGHQILQNLHNLNFFLSLKLA